MVVLRSGGYVIASIAQEGVERGWIIASIAQEGGARGWIIASIAQEGGEGVDRNEREAYTLRCDRHGTGASHDVTDVIEIKRPETRHRSINFDSNVCAETHRTHCAPHTLKRKDKQTDNRTALLFGAQQPLQVSQFKTEIWLLMGRTHSKLGHIRNSSTDDATDPKDKRQPVRNAETIRGSGRKPRELPRRGSTRRQSGGYQKRRGFPCSEGSLLLRKHSSQEVLSKGSLLLRRSSLKEAFP